MNASHSSLCRRTVLLPLTAIALPTLAGLGADTALERGFKNPPYSAKPWVYWFVMDGNLSREGITADFEAMKQVGLGGALFMEVDVGIPKGPVRFMSPPWRELFKHANQEAARLGLTLTMPASPGWTGSGGPWVKPEQSMQKLVFSETNLAGPLRFTGLLPAPPKVAGFYRDVAALAFPTPAQAYRLEDIAEKALYHRGHFSSEPGVKAWIPSLANYPELSAEEVVPRDRISDLSDKLDARGRLVWDVPPGNWTVLRFGHTSTGANTRPAPEPGLGLECDKLDKAALAAHFGDFLGRLLSDIGPLAGKSLIALHIDSWEMGPQNWTARFPQEFQRRRGYDLTPLLPVMTGRVVESLEVSERFLWDLRQTVLELIAENHAGYLAELARQHGLGLSIEPYDGTPCDDMTYGSRADVPMGEFWRDTFTTWFTCAEAASIAHTGGKRVVQAEAFTSGDGERWLAHPATLKTLGDWAYCEGINRFVFHRYAHQPWLDRWPGMTMGPYGIHYERTQTWWEQSRAWIQYLARCQFMLQQGLFVADVCFLKPEASPQVFRPPATATRGNPPERLGYNFDGCTPEVLRAGMSVEDGRLVLPDGMSYRVLVLPESQTMTPGLLRKIKELAAAGATVVGPRPLKSPSLSGFPQCDGEVARLAGELWGDCDGLAVKEHAFGKGRVVWERSPSKELAPSPQKALAKAKWIWQAEGNPAASAPVGKRFFRRLLTLEGGQTVASAHVTMTADNSFELFVNGRRAGSGDNFHEAYTLDVAALLKPGTNLLAVVAENGGDTPNPAGLIGCLAIQFSDGSALEAPTDHNWQAARAVQDGWASDAASADGWAAAMELGPPGMAPWGAVGRPIAQPEMFGDFSVVSRLLGEMGVPPDFASDGPFRYLHRRAGQTDIYFVANREDRWVGATCAFRVSGKAPELWAPLTGRITRPAAYCERDGRTFVPLWLGPAGSVFVVFRDAERALPARPATDPVVAASRDGQSVLPEPGRPLGEPPVIELFSEQPSTLTALARLPGRYELKTAMGRTTAIEVAASPAPVEVAGPWEVRFQPNRGAPAQITLERLMDWSKHPEPGVRHFSGTAACRTVFRLEGAYLPRDAGSGTDPARPSPASPPGTQGRPAAPALQRRLFLDLGRVEVIAEVKLNGKDLGILWSPPFCVDVTDASRAGENVLELTVANLWPNRLIGDQSLPPEKRIAWTTWNPFAKDTPLLESGLLGPVVLRPAQAAALDWPPPARSEP